MADITNYLNSTSNHKQKEYILNNLHHLIYLIFYITWLFMRKGVERKGERERERLFTGNQRKGFEMCQLAFKTNIYITEIKM